MSTVELPPTQIGYTPCLATRSDLDTLATLLAQAFHDDPLTVWAFPDAGRRAWLLPDFFRVFLDISLDHDGVYTTADRDAALLFLSPSGWAAMQAGQRELEWQFAEILGDYAEALLTIVRMQAEHHPEGRPHYYVTFAGVSPQAQRRGAMSTLVSRLAARADREGLGIYTEVSSPGGEASFRRLGAFTFGTDIVLPGGPALRPMWREPR